MVHCMCCFKIVNPLERVILPMPLIRKILSKLGSEYNDKIQEIHWYKLLIVKYKDFSACSAA